MFHNYLSRVVKGVDGRGLGLPSHIHACMDAVLVSGHTQGKEDTHS